MQPVALIVSAGAVLAALGVILASLRRVVRGLVDVVGVGRALLQLQPRVVDLGERLVVLVNEKDDHERRLQQVERVVFHHLPEGLPHVP